MRAQRPAMTAVILFGLFAATIASCQREELPNGLYARIVTSRGPILVSLDYRNAPLTAGNFAGLAEGSLAAAGGRRFYDGLAFHRVVADFVVQGGDPAGDGTGGPGYSFPDEFSPQLRHSAEGVLSMANSGPDSNGSQFFITLADTPWLDDKHSAFGRVVEGMDVVKSIVQGDRMESVEILRIGSEAKAFRTDQTAWDERVAAMAAVRQEAAARKRTADIAAFTARWPDLVVDSDGIHQKTLKRGSGEPVLPGQTVQVIYKGMFMDGKVFDQSALHGGPFRFQAGVGAVIPGWDLVVTTMRKGERRLVVIPPELAYGSAGAGGVIPPDAFLAFDIEVVAVVR